MHRMNPESPTQLGVAILARAPVAGQAKTRLIAALGAEGAAALQHWLLQRTVAMALAASVGPVTLWCAGELQHPVFASCRAQNVTLRPQPEGTLGERMLTALQASPATAGSLVIGTDCPALRAADLRVAALSLQHHDAVVFPAEDGGYVLIGMKAPIPEAFSAIDWGTDRVMAQTRARLRSLQCTWAEPLTLWDVDRPDDLARLFALCPDVQTAITAGRLPT
jgi:rSAM/selenodomain-associated transferase 1